MKVKIIGKAHREGTSKAGKAYNFNEVHYVGKAYGVEGHAALTANLDGVSYPYASILVGQTYNLEFDNRGYVMDFSQVR